MNPNPSASPISLSGSEQDRLAKVQALATQGSSGMTELIGMLTDPSWVVRRAVVLATSTLGGSSVEALCSVLKTQRSNEAGIAATVDALVMTVTPGEEAVLKLADDADPAIVADVVQIVGRRRSQSSIPTLIRLTKHQDDNVAVGAIEALGRIGGRAAVEALIDTVNSGNFFRTFPAIDVLGRSADPRAVEPLVKLLANPTYLPEAARALGRSGEKAAVRPLLELIRSRSDSVIRVAALSVWELRERYEQMSGDDGLIVDGIIKSNLGPEAARRLTRVLSTADVAEGVAICKLLGTVGDFEAAESLTLALDYVTPFANAAAEALKKIGKDAEAPLLNAIREGDSGRRKVLLPLITRVTAALDVANCLKDADPEVRALACDTLAKIGNSSVVSNIFQLLSDSNLRVVHAATAAIQSLGTREARQLAAQAARDQNPVVRRCALQILGYFGDPASLEPLLEGLKDPDARVREIALQGLPLLDDPRAIEAVVAQTKSPDARTRSLAVRSLGQVPKANERICSILLRGLSDPDPWVRYYSCQSIGRLGYSDASSDVANLLYDEAGQVRVAAIEALSHLESQDAHEALKRAVNFDNIDMRRAALVGLGIVHRTEDLPILLSAVKLPDVPTRLIALSALVNFTSPLVLEALENAGSDASEQVRSAAIGFLAGRSEPAATEILISLIQSEQSRERAKAGLLIPSQNRLPGLLVALNTANDELAPELVSIISKLSVNDVRKGLLAAMKLENVAARKATAVVLASRRDPEMREALQDAAENDPDESVKKICALLLKD